jgi:hypothetical protein
VDQTQKNMLTKLEKRAIKIVELQEELEEAKGIITKLLWPEDGTKEAKQKFEQKAARFVGSLISRPNLSEGLQ